MKYSTIAVAASSALLAMASPIVRDTIPGVLSLPITHQYGPGISLANRKRESPEGYSLTNEFVGYYATVEIGTPGQENTVQIDTGSSDLWVYGLSSGASTEFNSAHSSTYSYNNSDFSIDYVSGSASGIWATDVVSWGSVSVESQSFGINNGDGKGSTGVFGIGYISDESSQFQKVPDSYINFPQNLVDQGFIAHNAYSLYLDDVTANSGAILFGGVDSDKYTGQLYTVPVTSPDSFQVTVSDITYNGKTIAGSFSGILDSGTSYTYLPNTQFQAVINALGATYVRVNSRSLSGGGGYFLKKLPSSGVTYSFSGATVTVPPSELAIPLSDLGLHVSGYEYFVPIYSIEESSEYVLLGDSFLRSAYVVYDLDNKEISIAQSSFDTTNSNIQAITDSVPGAKPAPHI
jgi:candidapepsin